MDLIINEDNLQTNQIQEFKSKVRAILIDENNNILIANYGGIYLLPGGSVDKDETTTEALIRELYEETGQIYNIDELNFIAFLEDYQRAYPTHSGTTKNRLVQTYYYLGQFKGISNEKKKLTEKELKDGFKLELINIDTIVQKIKTNNNNNPRNRYFKKELLTIINFYNNTFKNQTRKIKKLTK